MQRFRALCSSIVLAAFLVNTTLLDLAFAQSAGDKLAVPSICDDLVGIEHKDMGRVKVGLQDILKYWAKVRAGGAPVSLSTFKTVICEEIRKEPTIFSPVNMQFMFHEMSPVPAAGAFHVECRITDDTDGQATVRKYHALFSFDTDRLQGFPVLVFTDDQYKQYDGFSADVPALKEKDAFAIDRYVEQNEAVIDPWIAKEMTEGEHFTAVKGGAAHKELVRMLFSDRDMATAPRALNAVSTAHPNWLIDAVEETDVNFIKVRSGVKRPVIMENGRPVTVTGHTSRHAVYIFLDEDVYDTVCRGIDGAVSGGFNAAFGSVVVPLLIHEMGVKFDFAWHVTEAGTIENDLDVVYALMAAAEKDRSVTTRVDYRLLCGLARIHIDNLAGKPVDLDLNLVNRDYAVAQVPGMGPEAMRLAILLSGLFKKTTFTREDCVKAYEAVRAKPTLLDYRFPAFPEANPYLTIEQDLDALTKGEAAFLTSIRVGTTTRYRVADRFKSPAYAMNFRIFAGLADYYVQQLGFTGVHFKDNCRFIVEQYRNEGRCRDQVKFDLGTGDLSFITVESGRDIGSRLTIGTGSVAIRSTQESPVAVPFDYKGDYPVTSAIIGQSGGVSIRVSKPFHERFLAENKLRVPLVTISSEEDKIAGATVVITGETAAVALAAKEIQTRPSALGRPTEKGKNWADALTVIALHAPLQKGAFTVRGYLAAYNDVRAGYPEFEFAELAKKRPDSTARRDLQALLKKGYLTRNRVGRAFAYRLTEAGEDRIAEVREQNASILALQEAESVIGVITKSDHLQRLLADLDGFRLPDYTAVCPDAFQETAAKNLAGLVGCGVFVVNELGRYSLTAEWRARMLGLRTMMVRSGRAVNDAALAEARYDIHEMDGMAEAVGLEMPTNYTKQYTFLLPQLFFAKGDLERDQEAYGARFALKVVPGLDAKDFVRNLKDRVKGKERTSIVLIPNDLDIPEADLRELTGLGLGIRFMQVDSQALSGLDGKGVEERARFRLDIYAIMWLARHIDKDTPRDAAAYKMLRFYLKTHFTFQDGIAVADDYINALVNGDVEKLKLIRAYLAYKPIVPHDAVADYHAIAAALVSA